MPRAADLRTSIRPTVAVVDLGAITRNLERVRNHVGAAHDVWAVVKADAYGHGAVQVGRAIRPRAHGLAVSLVEEGVELRDAGIDGPILVLSADYGLCHADVLARGLTPVVHRIEDLLPFARAAARVHRDDARIGIHLKVDTGMTRLGIAPEKLGDALDLLRDLPSLRLEGVCTHLASADAESLEDSTFALARFAACVEETRRRGFVGLVVHAANSAGAIRIPDARWNAVRPGIALYGALPSHHVDLGGLEPALRLETRIMAEHVIPIGGAVSYGAAFRARRPSRIATLPIGYADGYPRHVTSAVVLVRGQRAPIVGSVCMDMLMVDVTDVPHASVGDEVVLLGRQGGESIGLDELASRAGTVGYEVLCGISKRVPRAYVTT